MKQPVQVIITVVFLCVIFLLYQNDIPNYLEKKRTSGALEALTFWTTQRAYPEKTIPDHKYFQAFKESKLTLQKSAAIDSNTAPWESIGPNNIGGRTNAIAINPQNTNTIYAGGASGGLWISKTAGVGVDAWDYVDTGFPVLGVNSIVIDPVVTNVIYIASVEV